MLESLSKKQKRKKTRISFCGKKNAMRFWPPNSLEFKSTFPKISGLNKALLGDDDSYTDGRIVRTQRFFETKVRTQSKLEPTNFKIGSKFHFFLHKWLKTKKSFSRPCSRVSGELCTKCCISYIKRTLDSRTHEISKGKKCNFTCINDWKWRSLSVNPSHGPVGNYVRNAAFRT